MTFLEALDTCFRNHDRITRPEWNGKFGLVEDGILKIDWLTDAPRDWIISEGDFFAVDWELLDASN